jgi:5-deoxy-glucuronate isomerase
VKVGVGGRAWAVPITPPRLHLPAGSTSAAGWTVRITPEDAGWRYAGLRLLELAPGESRSFTTGADEMLVLPLRGSCAVEVDDVNFEIDGRESVFDRVTDFVYLPVGATVRVRSPAGCTLALPSARAERRFRPSYGPAEAVPVEVRGAGAATRQLNNFFAPDVMEAQRLVAVEVLTPAGNTSSYPPHKHDRAVEGGEAELEEIYYFGFARPGAFGLHRTYDANGEFDVSVAVGDGDVFLVPRGFHGPCAAMPGYDMYYLNVLA